MKGRLELRTLKRGIVCVCSMQAFFVSYRAPGWGAFLSPDTFFRNLT